MKKLICLIFLSLVILVFKSDTAIAQTCTTTPPTNTGTVTLSATATEGTYRVWARMKAATTTSNNSFYLKINNGCAILVGDNSAISSSTWTWVDYQNGTTTNKIDVSLTSGSHVVTIIGNETGVGVDKILMTKNLSCVPTGTSGDNCPAELIVSPTIGTTQPSNTPLPTSAPSPTSTSCNANPTITVTPSTQNANNNQTVTYQIGIKSNDTTGCSARTFTLSANLPGSGWTGVFSPTSVSPQPGQTSNSTLSITVSNGATAGSKNLSVSAQNSSGTTLATQSFTIVVSAPSPTTGATSTPTITPTSVPNATLLRLNSVKLHGIGTGGDNTNPNLSGNLNPLRTTRSVSVELIDSAGNSLPVSTGNVIYKTSTGDFAGDITINSTIPSGAYIIKIKSPGYLKKQLVGIITVTQSTTNTAPNVVLITGDINNDNSLTISDYNILIDCYSDLLPPKNCSDAAKKTSADLSDDGNVNANDYNLFLRELSVVSGN